MKFEHPLAKYRSTLSVDILGRSTCRPTLSWLTVKMSPDMLVNMLANMSTEGQWTYQSIGHPHSANTLMILGWLWLTLLLELHFLHVSSNFCRFHWQGIDLSNVKKLSAQFFLRTFLRMSCMLHSYLIEEAQSSRGYELWFVVRLLKWVALLNILWPTVCSYILVLKLCCMMVNCKQYSTNSWPIFC